MPNITTCSVRVMRSHDYCHFEVILTGTPAEGETHVTLGDIDDLRKHAARLADKAVEQYKVAKLAFTQQAQAKDAVKYSKEVIAEINAIVPEQRTPEQQAHLKAYKDAIFRANHSYDYEDDWQTFNDED